MLIRRVSLALLICVAAVAGILVALPSNVPAQQAAGPLPSGTTVVVFLVDSGNQPEPDPGPPTDKLIYTGGPVVISGLPGCTDQAMPLQNAVLVDPGAGSGTGRSGRIIDVFTQVTGGSDGVPPGTVLQSFVANGGCTSDDGTSYRKYTATVE